MVQLIIIRKCLVCMRYTWSTSGQSVQASDVKFTGRFWLGIDTQLVRIVHCPLLLKLKAPLLGLPDFFVTLFSMLLRPADDAMDPVLSETHSDAWLSLRTLKSGDAGASSSSTLPSLDVLLVLTSHCSFCSIMRATSAEMASRCAEEH